MTPKPDFISIAMPLVNRGFRITPVNPLTKQGCVGNWQDWQATTPEKVLELAKYFPNHNVAVVGKRKPGRHMFFDDDSGVAPRIEKETGQKIPATYTVATRPDSNHRHFYFTQTEYSFKRFAVFADNQDPWQSKNVNRRDTTKFELSRAGLQIHPTIYDLKGIGGGSFVVAAGSVRESGEVYTCIDDGPVVPIPDWLVDWFIQDIRKYHDAKATEKAEKLKERIAQGRTLNVIAEEDVYDYLRWRAHHLVGLGLIGEGLENALTHLAKTDCDKGETFVASEHGKELIHKIAFSNWEPGVATWFYQTGELKSEVLEGHIMIHKTANKHEVMERVIKSFPDKISTAEVYERLAKGMEDEDLSFDRHKDRTMMWHARKAAGFELDGHVYWVRATVTA